MKPEAQTVQGWPPPEICDIAFLRLRPNNPKASCLSELKDSFPQNGHASLYCASGAHQCDFLAIGDFTKAMIQAFTSPLPRRYLCAQFVARRLMYKKRGIRERGAGNEHPIDIVTESGSGTRGRRHHRRGWSFKITPSDSKYLYVAIAYHSGEFEGDEDIIRLAREIGGKLGWVPYDIYNLEPNKRDTAWNEILNIWRAGTILLVFEKDIRQLPVVKAIESAHLLQNAFQCSPSGQVAQRHVQVFPLSPQVVTAEFFAKRALVTHVADTIAAPFVEGDQYARSTAGLLGPTFDVEPSGHSDEIRLPVCNDVFLLARSGAGKTPLVTAVLESFMKQVHPNKDATDICGYTALFITFKKLTHSFKNGEMTEAPFYPAIQSEGDWKAFEKSCKDRLGGVSTITPKDIIARAGQSNPGVMDVIYTELYVPDDVDTLPDWLDLHKLIEGAIRLYPEKEKRGLVVVLDEFAHLVNTASTIRMNKNWETACTARAVADRVLKEFGNQRNLNRNLGIRLVCILQGLDMLADVEAKCTAVNSGVSLRSVINQHTMIVGPQPFEAQERQQGELEYKSILDARKYSPELSAQMNRLGVDTLDELYRVDGQHDRHSDSVAMGPLIIVPPIDTKMPPIPCHFPKTKRGGLGNLGAWMTFGSRSR